METPNFWASTYLSAATIPPLLAATKHCCLVRGQQAQRRLRRGRRTRRERCVNVTEKHFLTHKWVPRWRSGAVPDSGSTRFSVQPMKSWKKPEFVVQFRGQDSSAPSLETAEGKFRRPRKYSHWCHFIWKTKKSIYNQFWAARQKFEMVKKWQVCTFIAESVSFSPWVRSIKCGWGAFPCRWSDPRKWPWGTKTGSSDPPQAAQTSSELTRVSQGQRDDLESRGCFGWTREQIKSSPLQMNRFRVKCKWSGRTNTRPWAQQCPGIVSNPLWITSRSRGDEFGPDARDLQASYLSSF